MWTPYRTEEAPRFDAARQRATDLAPAVQRNLARFRKDAIVVKALLAVTAADLDSEDVAESVESFGALILPVFRERFPQILDAPYTKDYTIRRPPVEFHGRAVQLPEERSLMELDGPGQRAVVILEDVLRIQMDDAIDDVRRSIADDIEEQVDRWLHNGMDGRYASVTATSARVPPRSGSSCPT